MARVSFEQKLCAFLDNDRRFRLVGKITKMVCFELIRLIQQYGDEGIALRLGYRMGYPNAIATMLDMEQTEYETQLGILVDLGLVLRDAAGSIALPAALMPTRREIANRLNGSKGGRPRKAQSDPTPASDPRQTSAKLPIAGGRAADAGSGNPIDNPASRARGRSLSLASESSSQAQASQAISEAEFQRVGRAAFQVAFDDARDVPNWGIVRQWLTDAAAAGVGEADREAMIVGIVAQVHERASARQQRPGHLGYFTRAVAQAIGEYRAQPTREQRRAEREFEAAMERHWDRRRAGDKTARMPVLADFMGTVEAA